MITRLGPRLVRGKEEKSVTLWKIIRENPQGGRKSFPMKQREVIITYEIHRIQFHKPFRGLESDFYCNTFGETKVKANHTNDAASHILYFDGGTHTILMGNSPTRSSIQINM